MSCTSCCSCSKNNETILEKQVEEVFQRNSHSMPLLAVTILPQATLNNHDNAIYQEVSTTFIFTFTNIFLLAIQYHPQYIYQEYPVA